VLAEWGRLRGIGADAAGDCGSDRCDRPDDRSHHGCAAEGDRHASAADALASPDAHQEHAHTDAETNTGREPGDHPGQHTHADEDTDADTYLHAHTNEHPNTNADLHTHANEHPNTNADLHGHADEHTHTGADFTPTPTPTPGGGALVQVCIFKFHDLNGDGMHQSQNEPFLQGWTFTITQTAPPPTQTVATVVTGAQGLPGVCINLPAGATYAVTETPQQGWFPTTPTTQTIALVPNQGSVTLLFGNR